MTKGFYESTFQWIITMLNYIKENWCYTTFITLGIAYFLKKLCFDVKPNGGKLNQVDNTEELTSADESSITNKCEDSLKLPSENITDLCQKSEIIDTSPAQLSITQLKTDKLTCKLESHISDIEILQSEEQTSKLNVVSNAHISELKLYSDAAKFENEISSRSVSEFEHQTLHPSYNPSGFKVLHLVAVTSVLEKLLSETPTSDQEMLLPDTPTSDQEVFLPDTHMSDQEVILHDNLTSDQEIFLPDTPMSDQEVFLPDSPMSDQEVFLSSTSTFDQEMLLLDAPQTDQKLLLSDITSNRKMDHPMSDKETLILVNPISDKEKAMPDTPTCDKETVIPDTPTCDKETVIPDTPTSDQEVVILDTPTCDQVTAIPDSPTCDQETVITNILTSDQETIILDTPTLVKETILPRHLPSAPNYDHDVLLSITRMSEFNTMVSGVSMSNPEKLFSKTYTLDYKSLAPENEHFLEEQKLNLQDPVLLSQTNEAISFLPLSNVPDNLLHETKIVSETSVTNEILDTSMQYLENLQYDTCKKSSIEENILPKESSVKTNDFSSLTHSKNDEFPLDTIPLEMIYKILPINMR